MFILIKNQISFDLTHPIFEWHFRNNPILPGAIQCAIVKQFLDNSSHEFPYRFDVKFKKMVDRESIEFLEFKPSKKGIDLINTNNGVILSTFIVKTAYNVGSKPMRYEGDWESQVCSRNENMVFHQLVGRDGPNRYTEIAIEPICNARNLEGATHELVFIIIETMGNLALEQEDLEVFIFYKFDDIYIDYSKLTSSIQITTRVNRASSILSWSSEAHNEHNELVISIGKAISVKWKEAS